MFDGVDIPAPLNITGTLDRTLWIFRHRYFPYLMICLVSFGIPFLGMLALLVFDVINFDLNKMLTDLDKNPIEAFYAGGFGALVLLVSLPAFLAEIALQIYTSALVRGHEMSWKAALKGAFSRKTLRYIPIKMFSVVVMLLFLVVGVFLIFIPVVGVFAWVIVAIAPFTMLSGMGAAIVVEEKRSFFWVIGRNIQLAWVKPGLAIFSSGLGFLIILAFNFSVLVLFVLVVMFGLSISLGTNDFFALEGDLGIWIMGMILFVSPMINIMLVIPLKSIFYSVLYYNMRSRREAFHLENFLDYRLRR